MDLRKPGPLPARRVRGLNPAADRSLKVLIFGSTGFIGSHVTQRLRAGGHRVVGTSRSGDGADASCDLRDPVSVAETVSAVAPDTILIAAGQASIAEAWGDPAGTFQLNTGGPFNVLAAAHRFVPAAQVILTSSAGVYGAPESPDEMPFREGSRIAPASPYGASKLAAETLCLQYSRHSDLAVVITRVFNQIGPGQSDAQAPSEFSRAIVEAEQRGDATIDLPVGDPSVERDFTDVRDTADALVEIMNRRTVGVFNVCSGSGTSLMSIIDGLRANTDVAINVVSRSGPPRPLDIKSVYGSRERLGEAIGWRPRIPLAESLADLLDDWRRRV